VYILWRYGASCGVRRKTQPTLTLTTNFNVLLSDVGTQISTSTISHRFFCTVNEATP
jgi:hypothetical protein